MKNKLVLAALIAAASMLAGCSLKEQIPETTQPESSSIQTEESREPVTESYASESTSPTEESSLSGDFKEKGASKIIIATDTHYLDKELTDFQVGFEYTVSHGDGKLMQYVWEITDAFIDEVKQEKPDLVVLSGDLTYNGEKTSHLKFAEKLEEIEAAGIPVIVIPGNHDINNPNAARFERQGTVKTESVSPEEFEEIYQDFGYNEAVSRDTASLSYVYQINDYTRALMLDTCQYEPRNQVGGMIRDDTYDWIEEQMEEAWDLDMNVIPISHHNLLDESEVYLDDCTIEHSEQLIDQLESWDVPLYLSGHLHVQHYMRSSEDEGIYEIVTSSLATPPCQYGIVNYYDDGSFEYHTQSLDLAGWAQRNGNTDKNLLNFKEYGEEFLGQVFYNQAQDEFIGMESVEGLTENQKDQMAKVYAELNVASSAGKVFEIREKAIAKSGYKLWLEEGYPSILSQYLEWIASDGTIDYNTLSAK